MLIAPYDCLSSFEIASPCPSELIRAVRLLKHGYRDQAVNVLSDFTSRHAFRENSIAQQAMIFSYALLDSIAASQRTTEANLYLQQFAVPQIELFNLLSRHVPLISVSGQWANTMIADHLASHADTVLLDIGIGTGRQPLALLDDLSAHGIRRLTLIAIEPDETALWEASRRLRQRATELGIALTFLGVARCIEKFDAGEWNCLEAYRGRLIINAAFAFHHIAADSVKGAILKRLRQLQPDLLILTEPHADYQQANPIDRLVEAWRHFSLVFRYLDTLGGLSFEHRTALKTQFFGRKIQDILNLDDDARVERHERAEQWVSRLRSANFRIIEPGIGGGSAQNSDLINNAEYLGLGLGRQTIVALIAAVPDSEQR